MTKTQQRKLFIGAAVIGGGYLAYEFFLKDLFKDIFKKKPQQANNNVNAATNNVATDNTATNSISYAYNGSQVNIPIVQPSPMGTPDPQLKWNTLYLEQGMRGQEVKRAQDLLNAISNIYGTNTIANDGVYGPITRSKMTAIVGSGPKTLMQVYKKYQGLCYSFANFIELVSNTNPNHFPPPLFLFLPT